MTGKAKVASNGSAFAGDDSFGCHALDEVIGMSSVGDGGGCCFRSVVE